MSYAGRVEGSVVRQNRHDRRGNRRSFDSALARPAKEAGRKGKGERWKGTASAVPQRQRLVLTCISQSNATWAWTDGPRFWSIRTGLRFLGSYEQSDQWLPATAGHGCS